MKHTISQDERTIFVTYIDEISLDDALSLATQLVHILKSTPNQQKFNFVLDITNGYLTNILSLKRSAEVMSPHFKHMNKAYIVGSSGIQVTFAKMFIKFIGSFINLQKLQLFLVV